jgi:fructose-1-phosphate kinase PfkB-like protein
MQTTVILESGSGVDSETGNRYIELIRSYAHQAPFLVLTGSLPPGFPTAYYASIIQAVKGTPGLKVCLDCEGETLRLAVEHSPQVIKVNSKEFQVSFTGGRPWDIGEACNVYSRLKENGLELLVITDGPRGAYIFSANQPPFQVVTSVSRWVNTAGAGDTFMAALLVGLQRGLALQEATRLASAAAASKLQHVICGSLCQEDLDYFLPLTRIEYLALPGN